MRYPFEVKKFNFNFMKPPPPPNTGNEHHSFLRIEKKIKSDCNNSMIWIAMHEGDEL